MSLVPSGCITVREALDRVGQEHFGPQWTGKEHKARADLPSDEEWQRRKELVKQKIAGAKPFVRPIILGSGRGRGGPSTRAVLRSLGAKLRTNSPSAEFGSLQAERDAYERLEKARHLLWRKLEAREWKAVVVNSSTGFKRPLSDDIWRTSNAKIYIEQGRAPVSQSSGWGDLFIVEPDIGKAKPNEEPRVAGEETHASTASVAPASNPLDDSGSPSTSAPLGTMEGLQQVMAGWESIDTDITGRLDPTNVSSFDVPEVCGSSRGDADMSGGFGAMPEPAPPKANKSNTGGSPPKWDWEGAFIEMARVAVFEDDPSRPVLNERVRTWFIEQTGSRPGDSQIRDKVKRFHETLWPPRT